jgi:3-dehydroquinate dehydratase|tara:strand:+ start:473 stop:718 length:246 start_codon:yes stop_codon:yes gene_type:complete
MKLKLNSIDKDFAYIDVKLQILDKTKTIVLRATNHTALILSNHNIYDMKLIIEQLDTIEILKFAKEMFKANKTLNTIKEIN